MSNGQVRVSFSGKGFDAAARDLQRAGRRGLADAMRSALLGARGPVTAAIRANTRILPQSGGLGDRAAAARIDYRVTAGNSPRVHITAASGSARVDVAALDAGTVRHPLYGNRRYWYQQRVRPGWFTSAVQAQEKEFERRLQDAVRRTLADIG